jgi:hypothetical protein
MTKRLLVVAATFGSKNLGTLGALLDPHCALFVRFVGGTTIPPALLRII